MTAAQDFRPVVAVPARDEAERLPRLLAALARQSWCALPGRRLAVVLVLNNCRDGSASVAAEEASRHATLAVRPVIVDFDPDAAHVGTARRLALDTARTLALGRQRAVLLTTDADAIPAESWIEASLAAVAQGADVVGGQLRGDPEEEARLGPAFLRRARDHQIYMTLADRLTAIIDPLPYDPWPRHHHHTGASLAVRADVYDRLGGLPALPWREDLAFVAKARAAGFKLRHAPEVSVEVSARLSGRAAGGMADCLKQWVTATEAGEPHLVESPTAILERSRRRRLLRSFGNGDAASIANVSTCFSILPADLHDLDGRPLSPERLVERFAPDEPDAIPTVPVREAIHEMERLIRELVGASCAA